jgi:hypothetical protein
MFKTRKAQISESYTTFCLNVGQETQAYYRLFMRSIMQREIIHPWIFDNI